MPRLQSPNRDRLTRISNLLPAAIAPGRIDEPVGVRCVAVRVEILDEGRRVRIATNEDRSTSVRYDCRTPTG